MEAVVFSMPHLEAAGVHVIEQTPTASTMFHLCAAIKGRIPLS
jgi:hypothetical protein